MQAQDFEQIRLPGEGVMLAADTIGPEAAPLVLFFHGGGQSRRSWRATARHVAEAGYRAMTIDLRGHGDSDWAPDGDYFVEAYARDIEAILDFLDRKAVLVGASRGGQAALIAASRRADRVALVMLADVGPLIDNSGVDRIRLFFEASRHGFASVEDAAAALSAHLGQRSERSPGALARAMRRDDSGRYHWRWDPRTASRAFLNPPEEGEALAQAAAVVNVPVVMVHAEHSDLISPASVARFRELTPQLVVVEALGVGHMFTGDRNDPFAADLLTYLARHAPLAS